MLLLWIIFVIYVSCLSCFLVCSLQPCGHLRERANLLALLYVMFSCVFVTFQCGVLGQVWYLIVSIPDLCLLIYFVGRMKFASLEANWGGLLVYPILFFSLPLSGRSPDMTEILWTGTFKYFNSINLMQALCSKECKHLGNLVLGLIRNIKFCIKLFLSLGQHFGGRWHN